MSSKRKFDIDIVSATGGRVPRLAMEEAVRAALERHGVRTARLSIAVVDDSAMRRLHRKHLNQRGTTDVLSFDLRETGVPSRAIDGELVLCADEARRQALRRGHSVTDELCFYAAHGILHLLGFDDRTPRASAAMYAEEEAILSALGRPGLRSGSARPVEVHHP